VLTPILRRGTESQQATILVVDDTDAGRYVTCRVLRGEGFRVLEAATGMQALELAALLPDVIVLDIKLPDISGFEVCRRLRNDPATANIPVLHLSATFQDDGSVISGLEGGADGYLTLPVEPPVLIAYVRALLRVGQTLHYLQQSEQRFRDLFSNLSDGVLVADPEQGRFHMVNQSICDMLGYTRRELEELGIDDIHPPGAARRFADVLARLHAGETVNLSDVPMRRKDGGECFVDIAATLLTVEDRPVVLGSFRDVTERRAMERRLAQSDRLASVGLLAAGVAHELNNPLAFVLYNLEAMLDELRTAASSREPPGQAALRALAAKAEACTEGAQRMRDIVRDLQTFSRVDRDSEAPLELAPVIQAVATMAANEIRFRARLELELDDAPAVLGDEGRLSQVLLNLLVNAAQAITEGAPDDNLVRVRCWRGEDEARIEVSDTGRGIPAEDLARLFDPFFTTKQPSEGTGLGLAICHRIVEEHGGHIEVESSPGEGSRFVVVLPLAPQDAPPAALAPPPPEEVVPSGPGRILVIDDEPQLLRVMRRLIERAGHEVVAAASGRDAQALLADDRRFDVVLCDLMMPDLLGIDLHAWLRELDPTLAERVVFLTGGTFTPRAQSYLAEVPNRILEKPLPRQELLAAIDRELRRLGGS
jgi:PAS domain S-box-containing protein